MQSVASLPHLIETALSSGKSIDDLMRLGDCSRTHIWRLRRGKTDESGTCGTRLRGALEGDELSQVLEDIVAEVRGIIGHDPERGHAVLEMLQNVTDLVMPEAK